MQTSKVKKSWKLFNYFILKIDSAMTDATIQQKKAPVKLTFKDIEFEVPTFQQVNNSEGKPVKTVVRQKIVKGVSGYALPGQTTYIMGSSGAGKTSLLNILSDRASSTQGKTVSGEVLLNDSIKLENKVFGNFAAYVMQDDILYEFFTPREALTFAARLKLKGSIEFQDQRVLEVLQELGLSHV
jgi:ABC-type multidrug transport system ATPase subunit